MMSEPADHSHVATNGRAELSLDDLAALHGGFAHFMVEISGRATRCSQAAKAKNRLVALHQLGGLTKTLKLSALVPQYAEAVETFIADDLKRFARRSTSKSGIIRRERANPHVCSQRQSREV
jgi:hypothetical protein